MNPFVGEIFKI